MQYRLFRQSPGSERPYCSTRKLTVEKHRFMEYFGAAVETTGDFTIEGNRYCRGLAESDPEKWYFLDQLHNPENPEAHVRGTGPEILSKVPGVTAVVGSIGSGGTLLGTGRYLKQVNDKIKIFAVEGASGTRLPGTAALVEQQLQDSIYRRGVQAQYF